MLTVFACALAGAGLAEPTLAAGRNQKRKNEEPKSQVTPLPAQPPMALKADTQAIDFHVSSLLKTGGLEAQIRRSLTDLIRDTRGETILKLRAFVAGAGDARRVQAEVSQIFTERKLPLPVLTVVQVGALGEEAAKVVIEAVVETRHTPNPHGLAFFAGQEGGSLDQAIARLKGSAEASGVPAEGLLTATCFTARLEGFAAIQAGLQASFPHANVNLVQAVRDPVNEASRCEGVGQLKDAPAEGPVVLLKEHRAALVGARQIVLTGMQLSFGSYLDDAHEAFVRLERSTMALTAVKAPVLVNVYSLDPTGGSALRKTMAVPPSTLTVNTVEGLPSIDASAGIEAILAPGVQAPVVR